MKFFLFLAFISLSAKSVSGIVTDVETGKTIFSVSAKEKNGKTASVSNLDGIYSIKSKNESVLVFSSLGKTSQELISVGSVLNFSLKKSFLRSINYSDSRKKSKVKNKGGYTQDNYEFMHGLGYDYSIGVPRSLSGAIFTGNGLNYVPRFIAPINSDLSFGISLPMGLSFTSSSGGGRPLGVNYAVSLDIHSGFLSSQLSGNRFGAFFGLGLGSYDLYSAYNDGTRTTIYRDPNYGPYAHFGLRIPYYGQDVTLAVCNWRGVNVSNGKTQVFSFKIIYEFIR